MRTVVRRVLVALVVLAPLRPAAAASEDDAPAGVRAFGACAQCHSLPPGVQMTGPSLAGVFGREAGSLAGFDRYSSALASSHIVWDAQTLDAWLVDPTRFIPDTYMRIRGIDDAQTRANLIALLRLAGPDGPMGVAAKAPEVTQPDLKTQPPALQVRAVTYCGDTYRVATADGRTRPFWENNLRFKTDHSANGPLPGQPVVMPAGMLGDRASVVFSDPEEITRIIQRACPAQGGPKQ